MKANRIHVDWRSGQCAVFLATTILGAVGFAQGDRNPLDMPIDAKVRAETIDSLVKALKEAYVFPDVGDDAARMLLERRTKGEYDSIGSAIVFSDLLTKHISEIAHDAHLRVLYSSRVLRPMPAPKPGEAPPLDAGMLERLKTTNYEFERVERLSGNIGYLKMNQFVDAERGGPVAAGAMAFLANTDGLILDLRQNTGGEPTMLAFVASYFFTGTSPVRLNDLAFRIEGTRDYNVMQTWTLPYVPGQKYVDKELYILTSRQTFSAAEEFTYDLQALKRATVVGEITAGGANPGGPYRLGDHFVAFVPRGHSINPVTKTNWENKGIQPNIEVPQKDALRTAHRIALEHLIEKTTDPQRLGTLKQALAGVETGQ